MPVPTSDGTIQPSVRDTSTVVLPINTVAAAGAWILAVGGRPVFLDVQGNSAGLL